MVEERNARNIARFVVFSVLIMGQMLGFLFHPFEFCMSAWELPIWNHPSRALVYLYSPNVIDTLFILFLSLSVSRSEFISFYHRSEILRNSCNLKKILCFHETFYIKIRLFIVVFIPISASEEPKRNQNEEKKHKQSKILYSCDIHRRNNRNQNKRQFGCFCSTKSNLSPHSWDRERETTSHNTDHRRMRRQHTKNELIKNNLVLVRLVK